jgi:hypothetical protein
MNEKCCIGLKLNSENGAWPVSLLAPQGLPLLVLGVLRLRRSGDQDFSLVHCFHFSETYLVLPAPLKIALLSRLKGLTQDDTLFMSLHDESNLSYMINRIYQIQLTK